MSSSSHLEKKLFLLSHNKLLLLLLFSFRVFLHK